MNKGVVSGCCLDVDRLLALARTTGPTGPQGEAGAQGAAGETPTLSIGTVSSGESASATITGAAPNYVLNLVLPIGPTGPTGPTGPQGAAG